jgi:hypothetical protein
MYELSCPQIGGIDSTKVCNSCIEELVCWTNFKQQVGGSPRRETMGHCRQDCEGDNRTGKLIIRNPF